MATLESSRYPSRITGSDSEAFTIGAWIVASYQETLIEEGLTS